MAMTPAGGQGSDTLYGGGSGAFMGGGGDDWMSDVIVGVSFPRWRCCACHSQSLREDKLPEKNARSSMFISFIE